MNNPGKQTAQSGFTLLEIMIVVVIGAIIFTASTLAIRGTSPEELLETEAQRLDRLIQLAQEEAILRGQEYGLQFRPYSYRFLVYDVTGWTPLEQDRFLRQRELPDDMEIELIIEDVEVVIDESGIDTGFSLDTGIESDDREEEKKSELKPQVFLLSSGEITPPFRARLVLPGVDDSYLVNARADGSHEAKREEF